jgi:hypothetical protein
MKRGHLTKEEIRFSSAWTWGGALRGGNVPARIGTYLSTPFSPFLCGAQKNAYNVRTCQYMSLRRFALSTPKAMKERPITAVKRRGRPHTVYLSDELSRNLSDVSERRKVDKSTIVRVAIERLLNDLENGQLHLPLGI